MMEDAMAQRNRAFGRAGLQLTHPNAAGIDIGSASHYVAVPPDRDDEPVREFASFTSGLLRGAFRPDDGVCVLRTQARSVQHMQKALVQMNIQLANVLADVVGASGQAILRAIVAGERNPYVLAGLKNARVHASDKHFASWLGLCPGTKITGGKVLSGKTKRCANRAAQALRLAAAALRSSQSALGAYFRRLCSRMDKPKAVTAAAHKLARLIYAMLTKGEECTDQGQDYYEERYRQRVLHNLSQRANKLGMKLVAAEVA
jgi:transposase